MRWFDSIVQDFKYALRLFSKSPGFASVVIFTLALGIGANTAVFSVLNAVLLKPLPYHDSDRLIAIWDREIHGKGTSKFFSLYTDYEDWKKNSHTLKQVAAVSWSPQASPSKIVRGRGNARSVFVLPVTGDFFSLLGVPAGIGRTFTLNDAGRGCAVVLADDFWRKTFEADRTIVGRSIRLDDQACTVLGVMPSNFAFLPPEAPVSMWMILPPPQRPDQFAMAVFARLKPGVPLETAQAEVLALHRRLHAHDLWGTKVEPAVYELHHEFTWLTGRNLQLSLAVMFAAVSFVLLICCVNVANLLLGRAVWRQREMAIRASLGSARGRLLRQLLTENLLLSLTASLLGTLLAAVAIRYFRLARPIGMPPGTQLALNAGVLLFVAILSILTVLLFGFVPAWRASHTDLNQVLKTAGRTWSSTAPQKRFGRALIVAEVMLTVVLLAGAGLLIESVYRIESAPLGFTPQGLLTTSIDVPASEVKQPQRRLALYDRIRNELVEMPQVEGVAFSSESPINGSGALNVIEVEGRPAPPIGAPLDTSQQTVSADYFAVMKIPLLSGRSFEHSDAEGSGMVAVVNEALVRKYFPDGNPVGQYIRPFSGDNNTAPWLRIVGVAGNEKRTTVKQEMAWAASPVIYKPLAQNSIDARHLIVRLKNEANNISVRIQHKIAAIEPDVPIEDLVTVSDLESKAMAYPRFRAVLLGGFAGLALVLALVGLFGVLSHSVGQRTQEIGMRMALGARSTNVLMMIFKEGLLLTAAGLVLGFIAVWILERYLSLLLYGVRGIDPIQVAALTLILLPAALAAMYVPARRASKLDPMLALRHE